MNKLVFQTTQRIDAKLYTTSDVIAECAGIKHHAVQQMIGRHEKALRTFGIIAFEMRKLSGPGRPETIYHLNEEQATLLITFLKNTAPVVAFKTELVRQFYAMRTELQSRRLCQADRKPVRRTLLDVIRDDPNSGKWDYKNMTDLAYKAATGKTAKQIRKERGAHNHDAASDYMTADEIHEAAKAELRIAVLKELGMDYNQIKTMLMNKMLLGKIA